MYRKEIAQNLFGIPAAGTEEERFAIIQNDPVETGNQDDVIAVCKKENLADIILFVLEQGMTLEELQDQRRQFEKFSPPDNTQSEGNENGGQTVDEG